MIAVIRIFCLIGVVGISFLSGALRADPNAWHRGKHIAEVNCARCHAIGESDTSPFEIAPPFRVIANLYPVEALAEAFAEGVTVGHPAMPEFVFESNEIDDLLTFLDSFSDQQ